MRAKILGFHARQRPVPLQGEIYHIPHSQSPQSSWCGDSWSLAFLTTKKQKSKKHTHRFITGLTAPSSRLSRQQHFPSWLRNLFYFSGFVPPPPKLTACQAGPLSCINDPFLALSTRRSTACVFIGHGFVGICISCCDKFENLQNVKLVNCFSLCSDEKITTDLNHMFTGFYRANKHK